MSDEILYSNSDSKSASSGSSLDLKSSILQKFYAEIRTQVVFEKFRQLEIHNKLEVIDGIFNRSLPLSLGNVPMRKPKSNDKSLEYELDAIGEDSIWNYNKSLFLYNKSIAFATEDFEHLHKLFNFRAELLHKLKLFKASLHSLELAIKYCPSHLEDKYKQQRENYMRDYNNSLTIEESITKECQSDIDSLTKLKNDRKHPDVPFIANCLELKDTENYGRGIFTNCDLNPGDVVAIDRAYATSMFQSYQYRHCSNCFKENWSLIPCPDCTTAMYCNEKCLQIAWKKFHKHECKISNYLREVFPGDYFMCFRLSIQTIELFGGIDPLIEFEETHQQIDVGSFNIFNVNHDDDGEVVHYAGNENYNSKMTTLNYHPVYGLIKDVSEKPDYAIENALLALLIYRLFKDIFSITTDNQKRFVEKFIYRNVLASRIFTYGLSVDRSYKPNVSYGTTLYPFASLINHSCAPNLILDENGTTATIIVLHPIKADEQLFYNYGPTHMYDDKVDRQEELKSKWNFTCQCTACSKDYPLLDNLPTYCIPCEPNEDYIISPGYIKLKNLIRYIKKLYVFRRSHSSDHLSKDICYYVESVTECLNHLMRRLSESVYMDC